MKDQTQLFYQIIQIVVTLVSLSTAIIIAISKIIQSKKIKQLKDEQIKLSQSFSVGMQSLKDERIKFLEIIGSEDTNKELLKKLEEQNRSCSAKQDEIKRLKTDLKTIQEAFFNLIVHAKLDSTNRKEIIPSNLISIVKDLFSYLSKYELRKVNAYEGETGGNTGVKTHHWKKLIDADIVTKTNNQEYELTSNGKIIYEQFKKYHD